MIKKIIAVMLAGIAAAGGVARAEESIAAHTEENAIVFTKQTWMKEKAVLSLYNKEGKLSYSSICSLENGEYRVQTDKAYDGMRARVCFPDGGGAYDVVIDDTYDAAPMPVPENTPQPSDAPEKTAEPADILKSTAVPSEKPGRTPLPDAYKSETAAKYAFAVVEKVSEGNVNGEDKYFVDLLWQGESQTIQVDSELAIQYASDNFTYMTGQSINALKKGDVIFFTYNIARTKINEVDLIYRPVNEEIALSAEDYGAAFEKLISVSGKVAGRNGWNVVNFNAAPGAEYSYVFGIVTERKGSSMTLYPKSGKSSGAVDIDLGRSPVVYTCDVSEKNKLAVSRISGITKTVIPARAYDEDDNVTFTSDYKYSYALVRLVSGEAADIIVFN